MGLGKRERELNMQVYSQKKKKLNQSIVTMKVTMCLLLIIKGEIDQLTRSSNYWHNSVDFILSFRLGPVAPQSG